MKTMFGRLAACALAILAFAPIDSQAHDYSVGNITVMHPWVRATPGNAKAGAGYLSISNSGETADTLQRAESNVSKRTELHMHSMVDGVMKMIHVEGGVEVPVGTDVVFEPGGLHVMFMGLKAPFKEGDTVPVTLFFEKAGELKIEMMVQRVGSKKHDSEKSTHKHTH